MDLRMSMKREGPLLCLIHSRISLEPFPDRRRERVATVAYQASKEIEQVLHHDNSLLYKPWQFRSYTPVARTLKQHMMNSF